jgi:D-xylose transport system substrate-binding protein
MKSYRVLLILLLFFPMFQSCVKSESHVKIGFLIHSLSSSRWQMDTRYIEQHATDLGVSLVVKNAEGDENVQLGQAEELLEQGVDVLIVVAANQNTAAGIVRKAHEHDVPVIAYDRLILNSDLDYLVSFEYEKVGQQMIEYAVQRKPKGNYVILWGDASDGNARFIYDAQLKAIDPYVKNGQINVVYKTFVEGWSKENAQFLMNEVYEYCGQQIDAIISSNDLMAIGAGEVLAGYGYDLSNMVITGQDATLEGCRSIVQGKQTMSIYKSLKGLAFKAVDLAVDVATGKKDIKMNSKVNNGRCDVPAILLAPKVVDKDNMLSTVVADGVFTKDEIYNEK